MNSIAGSFQHAVDRRGRHGLIAILRSVNRRESALFLLIGLMLSGINATNLFERLDKGMDVHLVLVSIVMPVLVAPFLLTGWLIADRTDASRIARPWRLVLGATGSALLATLLLPHAVELIGLHFNGPFKISDGRTIVLPDWVLPLTMFLDVTTFAGLSFAALEMSGRRRKTERALEAERHEQATLTRKLLESRLAAMQAQVEPQFLFDALVDIERLYVRDAAAAAANLDRLINYLRVALPRLRESGSSIEAEVELVQSYLNVVQALHGGRPRLAVHIDGDSARRTFYPMLLLPLVQRAVRRAGELPDLIDIRASERERRIIVVVRIAAAGLCAEDAELARVRERLYGLYGGRAQFACAEPEAGASEFTLAIPA